MSQPILFEPDRRSESEFSWVARLGNLEVSIIDKDKGLSAMICVYEEERFYPCDDEGICPGGLDAEGMSGEALDVCGETCPHVTVEDTPNGTHFVWGTDTEAEFYQAVRQYLQSPPHDDGSFGEHGKVFAESEWILVDERIPVVCAG
ncbi:hypothetical protein [Geopseudomonas aromaticivorans]